MSYYRPAKKDELVRWLLNTGLVQDLDQGDVEALAEALIKSFEVVGPFKSPS